MNDYLIEIGKNKLARNAIKKAGLPVPLPQELARELGPVKESPLDDRPVVVSHARGKGIADVLARVLARAGARVTVVGEDAPLESYQAQGKGHGRPVSTEKEEGMRPHALVLDATPLREPSDLRSVYDFFQPRIRSVANNGRVLIVARPPESAYSPREAAADRALDGFVRTVAREIGRKGATAHLVTVQPGAEARLEPVLRFLLSPRSAYMSGQRIDLTTRVKDGSDPAMVRALEGKVAVVTGSAQGIGAAIASALSREGAKVVCVDMEGADEDLTRVADRIGGAAVVGDITEETSRQKIHDEVKERFGGLDIIVHNAGVTRDRTLARMKPQRWDLVLDVNLISMIELDETLRPLLRDGGRIVCTSSVMGLSGNTGQSNYSASKAGIVGYVSALAGSLAERGICANAVAPGFIETRMTARVPVAVREVGRRLSNLSQGGQPEDVAEVVTFLASPGAAGITGSVVRVCGGMYMGA